jgi:hypothetical protein
MTEKIVGSKMKSESGYGQNGNDHASSDLPDENTTSGLLPRDPVLDKIATEGFRDNGGNGDPVEDLQRKIDDTPLPPAHGMKKV